MIKIWTHKNEKRILKDNSILLRFFEEESTRVETDCRNKAHPNYLMHRERSPSKGFTYLFIEYLIQVTCTKQMNNSRNRFQVELTRGLRNVDWQLCAIWVRQGKGTYSTPYPTTSNGKFNSKGFP